MPQDVGRNGKTRQAQLRRVIRAQSLWQVLELIECRRKPRVVQHHRAEDMRPADDAALVAIVGAVGTGFGALLTGLLQIAQQSKSKKIILQTQAGSRLEVPADISPEELDVLIEKLKKLDTPILKIAIP